MSIIIPASFDTPTDAKRIVDKKGYTSTADANGAINLWKCGTKYHANRMVYNAVESEITSTDWSLVEAWLVVALESIKGIEGAGEGRAQ